VGWNWNFGDGSTSELQNPSHSYAADGSYSVTLTVSDNDGATGSITKDATVSSASGEITLEATGYIKGFQRVALEWFGAISAKVDVFRDGTFLGTTENDGSYTDNLKTRNTTGTYTYQVCEEGTSNCSNEANVTF
jgi:PKD repeat protein